MRSPVVAVLLFSVVSADRLLTDPHIPHLPRKYLDSATSTPTEVNLQNHSNASCNIGYINLFELRELSFSASVDAVRGEGQAAEQLQCNNCQQSGSPTSAKCSNEDSEQVSAKDPSWSCTADFPNNGFEVEYSHVDCVHQAPRVEGCVKLVISLFGVFASTNGFAIPQDSDLHKASVNITESALATDCGACDHVSDRDYYDIRAKTRLYFSANRKVRRRSAPVENNKQLQCQDSENCLESVGLVDAVCLNAHNESSNPHWICEGALPNMRYRFYKTIVDCEPHPDPKIPCVLRGSCILIYEPFKPMSNFLIIAITTFIVSIVVCIFVSIKAVRRHRAESRAPPSAAADTVQNNYDPSTDIPPSYNTVERNPRRYSKPNLTVPVKQSEPETPPPPYETCSDKSLPL